MPGLCDWEPVTAGEIIRIETTGGGGWGDPLERDPGRVALDVRQDKVSREAAAADPTATAATSYGLRIMRERAEAAGARLIIDAAPSQGTRIMVSLERGS